MDKVIPQQRHHDYVEALKNITISYSRHLDPQEILALSSQFVGMVMALQDVALSDDVLTLIIQNIQEGNARVANTLLNKFETKGTA